MDFFIQRSSQILPCLLISFIGVFPFPVFSATSIQTFTVINLAFVLGLSLPIICMMFFYKARKLFNLLTFILLTISLLAILFLSTFLFVGSTEVFLLCSMLFLVFIYFSDTAQLFDLSNLMKLFCHSLLIILVAFYVASLYLYPQENADIIWAIVSSLLLVFTVVNIRLTTNNIKHFSYKVILKWVPSIFFSFAVFLWLNKHIDTYYFVVMSVSCYIFLLVLNARSTIKDFAGNNTNQGNVASSPNVEACKSPDDVYTNLPSQQQALQKMQDILKRQKKPHFAIIVFKPINFKHVNKILGHHNSDILLLQLAYCLQKSVESNKSLINFNCFNQPLRIARLQGIHFLVALELKNDELNDNDTVENLCQTLTFAVPDAMSFKSFSLNFELTFGISFLNGDGSSLSQTIAYAEDALLSAENNQLSLSFFNKEEVVYNEQHLLQMERLKNDIIKDNLKWYVQPQIFLKNKKLVGFELQVQWHSANNIPLDFNEFVDIAEHSGEIYLLTKQMITRAFKLILKLQRLSNYETVSIKLLSQYLLEPDLVNFIEKQIAAYNVPAKYLVIELPEKIVLSAGARVRTIIDELKSLEVNIGISDFSGSYDSLRYIRKMTIHQVKINCVHIADKHDQSENAIATALVELTHKMQLPLIGTSIDDKSIEQGFTEMGGELAQGDIISNGVNIDKIDTWINSWNKLYNPV